MRVEQRGRIYCDEPWSVHSSRALELMIPTIIPTKSRCSKPHSMRSFPFVKPRPSTLAVTLLVFAATLALAAINASTFFGPIHRVSDQPILSPQGSTWESAGVFNPTVVLHNGKYVMLYRAQDAKGTSR